MKIGIIGVGVVGGALANWLARETSHQIARWDPYKGMNDDLYNSDAIFICIPVKPSLNGQNQAELESCVRFAKSFTEKVFIRSTVLPGTNDRLGTISCPEFLTARIADMEMDRLAILCGDTDLDFIATIFEGQKEIIMVRNKEAELAKFAHNCFGAIKVTYFNMIYKICQGLEIEYKDVLDGVLMSGFINEPHTQIPGPDGWFGYGGACLEVGTRISTPEGYKNIEDLLIGDIILDNVGETKVTNTAFRYVQESICISSRGRKITGSKDHIHIVKGPNGLIEKQFKDINTNDWVFIPKPLIKGINKVSLGKKINGHVKWFRDEIEIEPDLARVLGLYLADGCSNKKDAYSVIWNFGESKENLAEEVVKTLKKYGLNPYRFFKVSNGTYGESRCHTVRIRSFGFYMILEKLGMLGTAYNKQMPILTEDLAPYLIAGWMDGDGSYSCQTLQGYSRSKDLISAVDLMLLRMGICGNLKNNGEEIRITLSRDIKKLSPYLKRINCSAGENITDKKSPSMHEVNGGWVTKIRSIKDTGECELISLETESHLYVANNQLTHNCFPENMEALGNWLQGNQYSFLIDIISELNEAHRKELK